VSSFAALSIAMIISCTAAFLSIAGFIDVRTQVLITAGAMILQLVLMELGR
jgi:hypothetical protein